MPHVRIQILFLLLTSFLLTNCALLQHGDDKNYTLCKEIEGQIQFGGNTSYTPAAEEADVEKRRLQATYDKLNCAQYRWLTF